MEKVSFLTGFPGFGIDFTVYYKRKILLLFLKGSWYNNRTQQPLDEIAKLCVEILLKKIKGEIVNRDYVLPINLISGGSI